MMEQVTPLLHSLAFFLHPKSATEATETSEVLDTDFTDLHRLFFVCLVYLR